MLGVTPSGSLAYNNAGVITTLAPAPVVTLADAAGATGVSLITDGTGPALAVRRIIAGQGVNVGTQGAGDIVVQTASPPAALSRVAYTLDALALVNPLYVDAFIALGWDAPGNDPEWVIKSVPAGGSYMAKVLFNGGTNLVHTATQVDFLIDLYPTGMNSLGDLVTVHIYPEADTAKVCPRYHATFLRTATDLVLTVERFNA